MRFLVDVCAGHKLAIWLRSQGHDVLEVRDQDCKMDDEDILSWATQQQRVLVTMDKDFSELTVLRGKPHAGIVRLENLPCKDRIQRLAAILEVHAEDLIHNAVIIQKGRKVRILRQ
jgi:predicted nuclease of predicted toxin-antitoxin system